MTDTQRDRVEKAIKDIFVPRLKGSGFKGSFPNFYRDIAGFISLINFQFFSSGGSFCINLSYADKKRENVYFKKEAAPKYLKVSSCREQVRLGAPGLTGDRWFSFGSTNYGELRGPANGASELAAEVSNLFISDALPWWESQASRHEG